VFYGGFDQRPAVIIRPADTQEVAQVVTLARDRGMELAVRSGGHSSAGHSLTDGGIVLDLSELTGLDIDPDRRTAWAQTGLTAGAYTARVGEHGPATGFGDTGSVGIGGITLGGFRLHELASIVGGMLLLLPATAEVVAEFIAAAEAAPEELSTIASVMPAPPMPFVPAEHHGKPVIMARLAYAGDAEAGERALAPFRAPADPIADMVRSMPYAGLFPPEEGDFHPAVVARTMFVDTIDHQVAGTILEHLEASDAPVRAAELRVLGGAMARVPVEATAFAHRHRRIMVNLAAFYDGPADRARRQAWVDDFAAALDQGDTGAYVNFLGDEGLDRVRQAYPGPTWHRLVQVKHRYDPGNLFRRNQNIPPGG
jgi:FAD/FMN-containing dehydrogenase